MHRKICTLITVIAFVILSAGCVFGVEINEENFPDPALREFVKQYDIGERRVEGSPLRLGEKDGILSSVELSWVTGMNVPTTAKNLKGIEHFTALDTFGCRNNGVTELNVSSFHRLGLLNCDFNKLTKLNVGNNPALYHLHCIDNQIEALDVSHNSELIELMCNNNPIGKLDVSNNLKLEILVCGSTDLRELNVTNNLYLTRLDCWSNHLTELDLSKNTALTDVLLGVQEADGLKVKAVPEGYEVCVKDYVSDLENIVSIGYVRNGNTDTYTEISSFDKGTGVALYENNPEAICYFYNTNSPNNDLLCVVIKRSLNIVALERSGFNTDGLIISDMTENSYLNSNGDALTESNIGGYRDSDYGKLGLAADGNSRIILRVQTDKPGTVSFSFNEDIGAKLESLSRKELSASDQLNTTKIDSDTHEVSAVLVAPERFPQNKNFPSDMFKIHVKFTDENGEITEDDLELKIEAAPVILIPGMFNPGGFTNVFAIASVLASAVNPGDSQHTFGFIQQELLSRGFKKEHIAFWNHGGRKGIKNLVGHDDNHLFTILANMFESYAQEGIVCTKADVIAHGMGGLIIREFLNETNKSDADDANNWSMRSYKQGMIHRVINIAVPHMGTPLANVLLGDFSVLANVAIGNDALAQTCLWLLHNKYLKIYSEPFLKEIAVGSDFLNNLPLPANVPMHFVYGDVKGYLDSFENIKDTAFMLFDLAKFVKSAGKNIAKYQKLSEYSDFVQFSNTLQNFNPKTDLELLKTINNLDDKILLRVASQQEAIIRDMMTNNEIRSFALSFAGMASQNPQVTGFFQILGVVSDGLEALNPVALAFNLYFAMQRVIFSGQAHDMFVPVDSAVTMLREYSTGFPEPGTNSWMDWRFRHSTLCQQGDVAYAVATILRRNDMNDFAILKNSVQLTGALPQQVKDSTLFRQGDGSYAVATILRRNDMNDFATLKKSVQLIGVSPQQVKADSTVDGELNLEGIDLENLCARNFVLTANQSTIIIPEMGTSVVKFTASTKNLVGNDVKLVIHKNGLDRTFPMYTDDGKSFEINIEFTSSDLGAMFAYCYTPNDRKLYVSNTLQFSCIRSLDNVDITEISFFGTDTLYTNVNLDIPAGLYAVDSDGKYYDVSSPLSGTQWTSTEIARVNDNGCIHGLKEGNTTLTATFRGLTASVDVEVSAALVEDNPVDNSISEDVEVEIDKPSLSNSDVRISATEGTAITAVTITATPVNSLKWSVSGNLPNGLTYNETTASFTISGTPSAGTAGTYTYTVTASNPAGSTNALITITVLAPRVPDYPKSKEINPETPSSVAETIAGMTSEQIAQIESLVIGYNITSLTGIEKLTSLKTLDLSDATSLTEVNLNGNPSVKEVNLSGNSSVTTLNLTDSKVEIVNAEGCNSLEEVNIEGNNTIKELRVSETNISSLNAKNCGNLEILECSSSKISSLNLEGCVKLRTIDFAGNAMRRFNAESFTRLDTLICGGQQERVQTFGHVFNLFSFIMSAQVSGFSNSAHDENKVLNVKCYNSSGREISSQYNQKTGEITFSQTPAKVTYDYDTGFENVIMDVAISAESETSSESGTGSSGGGCNSSQTSILLIIMLVCAFRFVITIKKQ